MDAACVQFQDEFFNAVFVPGITQHIPDPIWKDCISEIYRVLKPEQELILEELSIDIFTKGFGKIWKQFLSHPYSKMFSEEEFIDFIKKTGFSILDLRGDNLSGFRHFLSVAGNVML